MVTTSEDGLDRTFAALAHPTRRAILTRLARGEEASVTDLAEPFDVSLMAISKHVRVMEDAGLVAPGEKDGRVQRCSYDPSAMREAADWIEMHRRFWSEQLDSLARYLETPESGGSGESDEGNDDTTTGRTP